MFDGAQQGVKWIAKLFDTLGQQLIGRFLQRNAEPVQALERGPGVGQPFGPVLGKPRLGVAGLAKRLHGFIRQGIDRVGTNQLIHIHGLRIGGILGAGAGPQQALGLGTPLGQTLPALAGDDVLIGGIGRLGIGNGCGAEQLLDVGALSRVLGRAEGCVQPLVNEGVEPADKKAGHTADLVEVSVLGAQLLQAGNIGAGNRLIHLDCEQQGDVDIGAFADQLSDGRNTSLGGRDFDHDILTVNRRPQPPRLFDRPVRIVRQMGRNLKADIAVSPVRLVVDWRQDIGGHLNILDGQPFINVFARADPLFDQGPQGLVVIGALGQGLLENRRVGGDSTHPVVLDQGVQLARGNQAASNIVIPDALAEVVDLSQRVFHASPLFSRARVRKEETCRPLAWVWLTRFLFGVSGPLTHPYHLPHLL